MQMGPKHCPSYSLSFGIATETFHMLYKRALHKGLVCGMQLGKLEALEF